MMVFSFSIKHSTSDSSARVGLISTPHGTIETPAFIFCATKADIKGVTIDQLVQANTQIILSNTYHLMLQPGSELIKKAGGLHKFMGWNGPLFTDSGGFQIFSLGHGNVCSEIKGVRNILKQRTLMNLTEDGARFRSYIDGRIVNLTPEKSVQIQMDLGADIIVSMDECTPYHVSKLYTANSMEKSKRWTLRSLAEMKKYEQKGQALLAVIQGGVYKDLRQESANFANENNFHGFAIGGSLGKTKCEMYDVVAMTTEMLDKNRNVHLLGIGGVEDIFECVKYGIDTFDCVAPTRIARHGVAIVKLNESRTKPQNYINLNNAVFRDDFLPISEGCHCYTCRNFSNAYIHHLIKAHEVLAGNLISIHNIFTMNRLMNDIRQSILDGKLNELKTEWCGV